MRAELAPRPYRFHLFHHAVQPALRHRLGRRLEDPWNRVRLAPWLSPDFLRRQRLLRDQPNRGSRAVGVGAQQCQERLDEISQSVGQLWNQLTAAFEIRYPLLYRPLVEFMSAVPWDMKLRAEQDRVIQRRALRAYLPQETYSRRDKKGPDESIIRGLSSQRDLWSKLTQRPLIGELGFVDPKQWHESLQAASYGKPSSLGLLLSAISLEIWLRHRESSNA